jgi:hypothetical protein
MTTTQATIGAEVVRSKGDYVVGRVGKIIAIDSEKGRAQVSWNTSDTTWVKFDSLELTSIPYEIIPAHQVTKYKWANPKYKALA